jgi:hypothetical protein
MTGLDQAIRAWFSTRLEIMPCDDDIEAHESLQMAAHAVIAVLELHPRVAVMPGTTAVWVCGQCYKIGGDKVPVFTAYPCRTVRVIAEKLGVEAPDG